MRLRFLIISISIIVEMLFIGYAQQPLQPIGLWREHLPYKSAIDIAAGEGNIFCATPYSVFAININDNSTKRMSRLTGLSETGISAIAYNTINNKLLIAYNNSDLDIVFRNDIFNISEYKRSPIIGDKKVNRIFSFNQNFYLSTGMGIIVIDGEKYEVKDSWFIGSNGNKVNVNGCTADATNFYAATVEGLKKIGLSNSNPANYINWQLVSGTNGLPIGSCSDVILFQNKIIVQKNDSLFIKNNNDWNLFFTESGWQIQNIYSATDKIIISQRRSDGSAKITSLNNDGTIFRVVQQPNSISKVKKAILLNNEYWVADSVYGLTKFMSSNFENYQLNSPLSIATGEIVIHNNKFFASAGSIDINWQKQNNKNGVYKFSEGQWINYTKLQSSQFDSLQDIISIAVDPRDETVWAGSYGGGLAHIKSNNNIEVFKQNSTLQETPFDARSYRVSGLAFDRNNNLWISNYGATKQLSVRKSDGSWKGISIPFFLRENATAQIVIDEENQKWIVSPLGNGLICFNDANTIDNLGDDQWKYYRSGQGQGSLPSNNVLCIAKDKNGFIWIGTDDGIGVIQCTQNIFTSQGCDAIRPVVKQNGFNSYLFKGEEVNSIAIDGADRKWVATKKGVWLISADGEKVHYRFTQENSSLLSNEVKKIAIDGKTGEVYFATTNGICSFRSTATESGIENKNILIFPNPVPPNFNGSIAIRGVTNNAIVQITEMDGRLVYQTRAFGGQVILDGKDYKGRKISSGIYLVLISDEKGQTKQSSKIIFISK